MKSTSYGNLLIASMSSEDFGVLCSKMYYFISSLNQFSSITPFSIFDEANESNKSKIL